MANIPVVTTMVKIRSDYSLQLEFPFILHDILSARCPYQSLLIICAFFRNAYDHCIDIVKSNYRQ